MLRFFLCYNIFVNSSDIVKLYNISSAQNKVKFLKNSETVLVRILSNKGNDKYEAIVSGKKIILNSKMPLKTGSSFVGKINILDGKIQIITKDQILTEENPSIQIQNIKTEEIMNLLKNLGLPQDLVSLEFLKQMKQLGIKMDFEFIKKNHKVASKFKGKEKIAAQILTLLSEKGIKITENELSQLIYELDGDFEDDKNFQEDFIKKINQQKDGWTFFPFKFENLKTKNVEGKGCIKIFLHQNDMKILNLTCKYNKKEYIFNIEYKKNKPNIIRFYSEPKNQNDLEKLQSAFCKKFPESKVVWAEKDLIDGTSSTLQEIYFLKGEI